jgi:hypothetical protein
VDQKVPKDSQNVAGRVYDPSDYQKTDQLSSGLAETHEQISDAYMEGEIGAVIDKSTGKEPIQISDLDNNKK